jgi:D-glycero-alpha-D-manno-heptose-7-phosphate kinase
LAILASDDALTAFGELMHEAWQIKRGLSAKVSNADVDALYRQAKEAGAVGGKLIGAGGGGFMLLFVPPDRQIAVRQTLRHLIHVPFRFEFSGSQIIFYEPEQDYSVEEQQRAEQTVAPFRELERV